MEFPRKVSKEYPFCTRAIGESFIKMFILLGQSVCPVDKKKITRVMNVDFSGWTVSLFSLNQKETRKRS